jgi:N-acetylneuraminic acid mutarotase
MKDTRRQFFRPRHLLYVALGFVLACTDEPTTPRGLAAPEFANVTNTDPTRVLTVGVDAPANLILTGTVAGIVVLVDNALVDLSKATVDCNGQTGPDPKVGVWLKNNRRNVHIKGGGTGVIQNCGIGVLIGPPDPGTGEPGGSNSHVDGLEIHASQAMLVSNSHDNLINSNRLVSPNGVFVIGNDPKASASGKNEIYDNTITAGARFSIYASSDGNIIRGNVMLGEAVDAAIGVDRDGNVISDNQTEVGPGGDDPMVGIQVLSGADDNTITKNQVGAGDFGILVEANTFRNNIRGNTAIARSTQDAVDQSGDCVNNTWTKNTFRRSDPACIAGITLGVVTFTSPTTIRLDGPGATFNTTISNQTPAGLTDVSIQVWVEQGISRRVGGTSPVRCGPGFDVLPEATCEVAGSVVASNTSAGLGTLAVGNATAIIQLIHLVDGNPIVVDSRSVPLTLTAPAAGSFWEIRAPLPTPRVFSGAGVADGVLYAVGGVGQNGSLVSTVEAYDPVSDSWTAKAPLPTPRQSLAVGVVNGVLYAVGGSIPGQTGLLSTVEAYDPVANNWTTKAPMPTARQALAVGVVGGILYAVGGFTDFGTVEAYDPVTNTWTAKAPMPTPRYNLAVGVVNGVLYAIGGVGGVGQPGLLGTVEAYDPVSDSWTAKAPLPTPRQSLAAGVVNGVLYAVGGVGQDAFGGCCEVSGAVEAYDPLADSWTARLRLPTPRHSLAAGVVNGSLYAVGGAGPTGIVGTVEAYHP